MQLRAKVCIPIAGITLAIGICCYFVIQKQFERLNETNIQTLVEARSSQMKQVTYGIYGCKGKAGCKALDTDLHPIHRQ